MAQGSPLSRVSSGVRLLLYFNAGRSGFFGESL